jgi:hypothetical protein
MERSMSSISSSTWLMAAAGMIALGLDPSSRRKLRFQDG